MSNNSSLMVIQPGANLPVSAEGNGLAAYFEKIKTFPILSEEEEQSLIVEFKQNNNLSAAHRLVLSHLRL